MKNKIASLDENVLSRRLWKFEVSELLLISFVLAYTIIFSYFTIMLQYSFRTFAWDLGIIGQSISSATKGGLFLNNVELYYSATGSYFGIHFSPILFAVVPIFSLIPRIETLFVIETFVLAASAIPVYLIAKHHLENRLVALIISVAFLFNPLLQSVNWYYLTPQTFLPLFFLSATYFLKKRRMGPFLFFTILALFTLEQASYFVGLFAIYAAWELRPEIKQMLRQKRPSLVSLSPFIVFILAIVWLWVAQSVIYSLNPNPSPELRAVGNFAYLDINNPIEIPAKVITNPELAFKSLNFDFPQKLLYLGMNFAPGAFLSLLSPIALLPSLPWLFLSLLGNHTPYYQFGFHYTAIPLTFLTIALIEALQKIPGHFDSRSVKAVYKKLAILLLVLGFLLSIFASPLSPLQKPNDFRFFRDYGITTPSQLDNTIRNTLAELGSNAYVLTTPTLFPHIATNNNAYVVPPANAPSERLYSSHLDFLKGLNYDYVFYTYFWDKDISNVIYDNFIRGRDNYGLFLKGTGVELYKWGYSGDPNILPLRFSEKELATTYSVKVADASSQSGTVYMYKPVPELGEVIWFGPYITLTPGTYTANFRIKIDHLFMDNALKIDIYSRSADIVYNSMPIRADDFKQPLVWQTFSLTFTLDSRVTEIEFRGLEAASDLGIWLDFVEVIPE